MAGVLIDKAMLLIPKPPLSEKQKQEYFDVAIRNALAHGLTSVHDAKASPEMIDFFRRQVDFPCAIIAVCSEYNTESQRKENFR